MTANSRPSLVMSEIVENYTEASVLAVVERLFTECPCFLGGTAFSQANKCSDEPNGSNHSL